MESVEYKLQCMLPDLSALLERGLFTKEELRKVLEKRSQFEYSIRSSNRTPEDFYKYLQYEQKLEELRKLRSTRLSLEKSKGSRAELSEYCIVKHIHLIYSQATIVFKFDVELWKQWFAFCRESNSTTRMSKALADALRLNPHVVEFWILAAQWQIEDCQNANLARSIMQQAIRNCPSSKELWIEYFKLELTIIYKLITRRQLLDLEDASNENFNDVLNGALAFRVFQESITKFPKDLKFSRQFLQVLTLFSFPEDLDLESWIHKAIQKSFPNDVEVWDMEARFIFKQLSKTEDVMEAVKKALEHYFDGFTTHLLDDELYSHCLLFLIDVYQTLDLDENENLILSALHEQMQRVLEIALDECSISEKVLLSYIIVAKKHSIEGLRNILRTSIRLHDGSVALFQELIQHLKDTFGSEDADWLVDECIIILGSFKGLCFDQIWIQMIDLFLQLQLPLTKLQESYFQMISNLTNKPQREQQYGLISTHFLESIKRNKSFSEAESFAKKLLKVPLLDVGSYLSIAGLFQSNIESKTNRMEIKQVTELYEKIVKFHGDRDVRVWVEFIKFENKWRKRNIGAIYQRAQNSTLADLQLLHECLKSLN
eukprot:g7802.t1